VANQAFVPAELFALILLLPIVVLTYRMKFRPRRLLLVASMLGVFFFERLTPFNFASAPAHFDLWPFLRWFDAGFSASLQAIDWAGFFGLLFLLGALLWVIRYSGVSFNIAAGMLMALVVATEALQLWLPDRTGSLTDPVIALGVVALFRYTQRRQRHAFGGRPISRRGRTL
jgi:VanZ family protein